MDRHVSRRRVLGGTAALLGGCGVAGAAPPRRRASDASFTPSEHGFGFRNWSPRDQYFDAPPAPSERVLVEQVRSGWRDTARAVLGLNTTALPSTLVEAIATQLQLAVAQFAGTNGHCYGMALTAQQYFDRPETIPVDRRVASEIENPTVPLEEPAAPVYETIVDLQAAQFLRFRAWLGRRAMLHPEWIDTGAMLRDVESVVGAFGTATLTLFDGTLSGHQVLAYGFDRRDDGVSVAVYDPNRTAVSYRADTPTLRFDRTDGTFSMRPYEQYTGALFNRYDQIERATGREDASVLDHLTVGRRRLRESLFPLALVLVDVDDVAVGVVAPDGTSVDRIRSAYMNRSRGEYARIRSLYGAEPGTYWIGVLGDQGTGYELRTVVADAGGAVLDATRSATVDAGDVHVYDLAVPTDGGGSVDRADGTWRRDVLVGGAGAVGGAAAGVAGVRALRRRDGT
jgi:hypothetical protein